MKIAEKQILLRIAEEKMISHNEVLNFYKKVNTCVFCNVLLREDLEWFCGLMDGRPVATELLK